MKNLIFLSSLIFTLLFNLSCTTTIDTTPVNVIGNDSYIRIIDKNGNHVVNIMPEENVICILQDTQYLFIPDAQPTISINPIIEFLYLKDTTMNNHVFKYWRLIPQGNSQCYKRK